MRPGTHPPFLCTARRRAQLLAGLGVDAVCVIPFGYEFSQLGPDEFVRTVLADRLHAARVVVGENFRFGHKARATCRCCGSWARNTNSPPRASRCWCRRVTISTYIRERIAAGDVTAAAEALGRPHRVEGVVVRGNQRGRALGFPTANLETLPHTAVPADGVYAGWLSSLDLDGAEAERWPAAISIGTNPTFEGAGQRTVEAYALDRDDLDLYGAHVAVDFAARLRATVKFASVDDLVVQMRVDVDVARELTAGG